MTRIRRKKPYKEPMFLFTSSSMRRAAWAGWYSALGDGELAEKWVHSAHTEWTKEIGGGRRYLFLNRHNYNIGQYISEERLKEIVDNFLKIIKAEIMKSKKAQKKDQVYFFNEK